MKLTWYPLGDGWRAATDAMSAVGAEYRIVQSESPHDWPKTPWALVSASPEHTGVVDSFSSQAEAMTAAESLIP